MKKRLIGFALAVLLVASVGTCLGGCSDKSPPLGAIEVGGEESNAHEFPSAMVFRNSTSSTVFEEKSVTIHATVKPSNATHKQLDWAVAWKNPESEWAFGKTVTDYVTATPTSDGADTAVVTCKKDFGEQVELTVTARDRKQISVTCTIDFKQYIKRINFDIVRRDKSSAALSPVVETYRFNENVDTWDTPNGKFPTLYNANYVAINENYDAYYFCNTAISAVYSDGTIPMTLNQRYPFAVLAWYNPVREDSYKAALTQTDPVRGAALTNESLLTMNTDIQTLCGRLDLTPIVLPLGESGAMKTYLKTSESPYADRVFMTAYNDNNGYHVSTIYGFNWDKSSFKEPVANVEIDHGTVEF